MGRPFDLRTSTLPVPQVKVGSYEVPPMFQWLQKAGNVPLDDMRRTFNMGVGIIMVVDPAQASAYCDNFLSK